MRNLPDGDWGKFVNVCPASDSWKAFVRERFSTFIAQYGLTGIYMDNAQVYAIRHCLHGNIERGYTEYPLLDQRDSYQSIMEALRKN